MLDLYQKTIEQAVEISGIGLFTGEKSKIKLLPAPEDTGIVFIRNEAKVNVNFKNYKDTKFHCTCLQENGQEIVTIEHIMAALHCLDISNLYIKLETSNELPILDGSSEKFLIAIKSGIIKKQSKLRKTFFVDKNYEVFYKDTYIKARPSDRLRIRYTFVNEEIFKEPNICEFDELKNSFYVEFARAKTFSSKTKLEYMQKIGIFPKGGSSYNAIVYDNGKVIEPHEETYKDEATRHKILDFIGDFYSSGSFVCGEFDCFNSGHELNRKMIQDLFTGV